MCACLQVSEYVQADPVLVRVCDDTQAHVGRGVVEVANEIHRLGTPLGTQQGVQFSGSDHLIGRLIWYGTTGRWRDNLKRTHDQLASTVTFAIPPYLRVAWVKQRFRSVLMYLRHCCVAHGFDSTSSTDRGFSSSSFSSLASFCTFSSSLTKYTPDSSFPWVPPHTATRDNLGKHTTLSTSIWLRAGRDTVQVEGVCK